MLLVRYDDALRAIAGCLWVDYVSWSSTAANKKSLNAQGLLRQPQDGAIQICAGGLARTEFLIYCQHYGKVCVVNLLASLRA